MSCSSASVSDVPVHVQVAGGQVFDRGEALVEEAGFLDLVHELLRDGLARLVVPGVGLDDLGIAGPVLHDLRAELDEVARHVRPGEGLVGAVRRAGRGGRGRTRGRASSASSKVRSEGLSAVGLGEVADVGDDGRDLPAVPDRLLPDGVRPGAAALGGPREIVGVEDADVRPVGFLDLEDLDVGMVDGDVGPLVELEPPELAGDVEGALADVLELEVGLEGLVVEVVLGLLQLLGVVPPVPGLELDVRRRPCP